MARRRKSTANSSGKLKKDGKNCDKSLPTSADNSSLQEETESSPAYSTEAAINPTAEPETVSEEVCISTDINETIGTCNKSDPQNEMMLLDINQMILGDGQGEEIRVERHVVETLGEPNGEEVVEYSVEETETCLESSREDEYLVPIEEDEEEEVVYLTPEATGETQYVVLEFDSTGEANANIFINMEDLQSEIRTVERESDYESSQESMEEEHCENINSVIGTSGDHVVNYSPQYNSCDDSDNQQGTGEKEDTIRVTEHEAVLGYSQIETDKAVQKYVCNNIEIVDVSNTVPNCEPLNSDPQIDENKTLLSNSNEKVQLSEENVETKAKPPMEDNLKVIENETLIKTKNNDPNLLLDSSCSNQILEKGNEPETNVKESETKIKEVIEKKSLPRRKTRWSTKNKTSEFDSVDSCKTSELNVDSNSYKEGKLDGNIKFDSKGAVENQIPDSCVKGFKINNDTTDEKLTNLNENSSSNKPHSEMILGSNKNQSEVLSKSLNNIQEQKITSNSSVSDSKCLGSVPPLSPKKRKQY